MYFSTAKMKSVGNNVSPVIYILLPPVAKNQYCFSNKNLPKHASTTKCIPNDFQSYQTYTACKYCKTSMEILTCH